MNSSDSAAQQNKTVYGLLSLCRKAGRIRSGGQVLYDCIASGEAKLVLIAADASENTKKKCRDKCTYRDIPWIIFGDMEQLGRATGENDRAAVAVTDAGLARTILAKL